MGRPVVDSQRPRPAPDVDTERLPRERELEDPLPEIAGEEEGVRPARPQGRDEPELGHAHVLRLVHNHEVVRRLLVRGEARGEPAVHVGLRHELLFGQARSHALEDRPENLPLLLRQSRFPSEAGHVSVGLPRNDLPCVHDLCPLRE